MLTSLLAISPVYLSFICQLRGYGLSILLASVATVGAIYIVKGSIRQGLLYYIPAAALLPGVVPTNVFVNLSLFLFVNLVFVNKKEWRLRTGLLAIMAAASIGGLTPVLTDSSGFY